jgi:hypothetical protein
MESAILEELVPSLVKKPAAPVSRLDQAGS